MDSVARMFFDNLSNYDEQILTLSGKTYDYLDGVKEDVFSVMIVHITCNGYRCKNDFRHFPLFLQESCQHAHTSLVKEILCYAYAFGDQHHCFVGLDDRSEDSYTNICLFDNHVLRYTSIEPEHVTVSIEELLDRYNGVK